MQQTRHCALCENEVKSLETGVTCKLNGEKPDFNKFCLNILLDKKFKSKLENTNLKLERINKTKSKVYITFYVLILMGFLLIVANKAYGNLLHSHRYYWIYRVSAIAAGVTVLSNAYFRLNRFRDKLKIAKSEKEKIDSVLKVYNISYDIDFDYKDRIHGTQDIDIKISFKNWKKVKTKSTYSINY